MKECIWHPLLIFYTNNFVKVVLLLQYLSLVLSSKSSKKLYSRP